MARYRHLAFVCTNERDPENPKGSCAHRGADEVVDKLKETVHSRGLKRDIRIVESGCLNCCNRGVTMVVHSGEGNPSETWYTGISPENVNELFESHFVENQVHLPLEEEF